MPCHSFNPLRGRGRVATRSGRITGSPSSKTKFQSPTGKRSGCNADGYQVDAGQTEGLVSIPYGEEVGLQQQLFVCPAIFSGEKFQSLTGKRSGCNVIANGLQLTIKYGVSIPYGEEVGLQHRPGTYQGTTMLDWHWRFQSPTGKRSGCNAQDLKGKSICALLESFNPLRGRGRVATLYLMFPSHRR